jgi:hypothetical protein
MLPIHDIGVVINLGDKGSDTRFTDRQLTVGPTAASVVFGANPMNLKALSTGSQSVRRSSRDRISDGSTYLRRSGKALRQVVTGRPSTR